MEALALTHAEEWLREILYKRCRPLPVPKDVCLMHVDIDNLTVGESRLNSVQPRSIKTFDDLLRKTEFSVEPRVEDELDGLLAPFHVSNAEWKDQL